MEKNTTTDQKWYDKTWLVVVLCIVFFPVGLYALWKNASIAKGIKIGVTVFIALIVIANLSGSNDADKATTSSSETKKENTTEASSDKKEPASVWTYKVGEDKMSNEKTYFAMCESTNEIEFEFPYNGGSTFVLMVRNMGRGNEVVVSVSKGQFMTSLGNEYVRAKFDDGEPMNFSFSSSSDGRAEVIFIDNSQRFITKLKQAKKLMLEAPFFDAGRKIIEFDVAGLSWAK